MRDHEPRSEGFHAAVWGASLILMFAAWPVFILFMLWWFGFRTNAGTQDPLTGYVFVGGFALCTAWSLVCKILAGRHYVLMRGANARARREAHEALRRGDPTLMDRAKERRRVMGLVPLVGLLLGLLVVVYLLM